MQLVETKIIIALGQSAANFLLDNTMYIEKMRKVKLKYKDVKLFVTYSPSSLIIDEKLKKEGVNYLQLDLNTRDNQDYLTSSKIKFKKRLSMNIMLI